MRRPAGIENSFDLFVGEICSTIVARSQARPLPVAFT